MNINTHFVTFRNVLLLLCLFASLIEARGGRGGGRGRGHSGGSHSHSSSHSTGHSTSHNSGGGGGGFFSRLFGGGGSKTSHSSTAHTSSQPHESTHSGGSTNIGWRNPQHSAHPTANGNSNGNSNGYTHNYNNNNYDKSHTNNHYGASYGSSANHPYSQPIPQRHSAFSSFTPERSNAFGYHFVTYHHYPYHTYYPHDNRFNSQPNVETSTPPTEPILYNYVPPPADDSFEDTATETSNATAIDSFVAGVENLVLFANIAGGEHITMVIVQGSDGLEPIYKETVDHEVEPEKESVTYESVTYRQNLPEPEFFPNNLEVRIHSVNKPSDDDLLEIRQAVRDLLHDIEFPPQLTTTTEIPLDFLLSLNYPNFNFTDYLGSDGSDDD